MYLYRSIVMILAVLCTGTLTYYSTAFPHEEVHQIISESFGCNTSMTLYPYPYVMSDCSRSNMTMEEYNEFRFQHTLNEMIAYNTVPGIVIANMFLTMIAYMLFFIHADIYFWRRYNE